MSLTLRSAFADRQTPTEAKHDEEDSVIVGMARSMDRPELKVFRGLFYSVDHQVLGTRGGSSPWILSKAISPLALRQVRRLFR